MLNLDQTSLVNFVYEAGPGLPVKRRIAVYRGLVDSIEDVATRKVFTNMVRILEDAESRIADLQFPAPANPQRDGDHQ